MNENYLAMQHQDLNFYPTNTHHANGSSVDDSMLITNQECDLSAFPLAGSSHPLTTSFQE